MESVKAGDARVRWLDNTCGWCGARLAVGHELAVCRTCWTTHHARCWRTRRGCAYLGCVNEPEADVDGRDAGTRVSWTLPSRPEATVEHAPPAQSKGS